VADSDLHAALAILAREVARAVVAELRAGEVDMVDQTASPLGRRRHIAAVRARVGSGAPGAAIVGRRYLLARDALESELSKTSKPARRKPSPVVDLMDRYGIDRVAS
jgi:hypothetical protein